MANSSLWILHRALRRRCGDSYRVIAWVPLLVAFPDFLPGRLSVYTLTKLNHFTPECYGLDIALFTLSPRPHGLGLKTRFSVEG